MVWSETPRLIIAFCEDGVPSKLSDLSELYAIRLSDAPEIVTGRIEDFLGQLLDLNLHISWKVDE